MRLDSRALGLAAGATAGVLFTLCALAFAVAPGPTTAFFSYMLHLDLSALPLTLTLGSFVGGLICWSLGTALTFWFAAVIYNRLARGELAVAAVGHHRAAAQGA